MLRLIPFHILVFILVFTTPAFAYLDAGSGSMLLQLILGGVAGISVVIKLYWNRFKQLIGVRKKVVSEQKETES